MPLSTPVPGALDNSLDGLAPPEPAMAPGSGGAAPTVPGGSETWQELRRRGTQAALQLAIRSLILRAVTLVGTVILARLLAPADFGVFAIVALVVSVWSALGDFGLGAALVQQESEPTRQQLATAWTAQQLVALAAVATIWLAAPALATLLPSLPNDGAWMLRVLSLGLLMSSLRTLPAVMMERQLRFGPLATAEVLQSVTYYAAAVTLAATGAGPWAFVMAGLLQTMVATAVVNLAWHHRPTIGIDRDCLKTLLGFGFHFQASVMLVSVRDTPLPAIAGALAGAAAAGFFGFATRVAFTIASIEDIVGRIAFPAFSRLQSRPAEQSRALDSAIMLTALAVAPLQCWIATTAPIVVPLVFGDRWRPAIVPLQIVCVAMLLRFPTRYMRQAVFASGRSRLGLAMAAVETSLAVSCFSIGFAASGLPGGGIGFMVGALLGLSCTAWMARSRVRPSWRQFAVLLGAVLMAGAIGAIAGSLAIRMGGGIVRAGFGPDSLAGDLAAVCVATIVYAMLGVALVRLSSRPTFDLGLQLARRSIGRQRG
jgi:O-antigen/teichoic acid export membrane protein